ncbi:MAG: hypothetical protein QM817_07110 [Archangium sp.]
MSFRNLTLVSLLSTSALAAPLCQAVVDALGPTVPKTIAGLGPCVREGDHGVRCEVRGAPAKLQASFAEVRAQLLGCFGDLRVVRHEERVRTGKVVTVDSLRLKPEQAQVELLYLAADPENDGKPQLTLVVKPKDPVVGNEGPEVVCDEVKRALTEAKVTSLSGFESCKRTGGDAGIDQLECTVPAKRYALIVEQLDRCLPDWPHQAEEHAFGTILATTSWSDEWKGKSANVYATLGTASRNATFWFRPLLKP